MKSISIIIPAYNEQDRIGTTLEAYGKYFTEHYPEQYEIVVVLNGCKDNTLEVVTTYQKQFPAISILNYPEAIGKGGAIKHGLEHAKGDIVGFTDADGSTRPEILHRLFAVLELTPSLDCIVGSRKVAGAIVEKTSMLRKIMSWGFNICVNMYFQTGLKDTQCGAKVVRKSLVKKILPNLLLSDMSFDVNFIVDVQRAGGKILEMPIEWEDKAGSKVNNIKTSALMFMSITRLKILYSPLRVVYPYIKPLSKWIYNKMIGKKNIMRLEDN
jgi:glycosyltransferase involved in cell wall biosynthesis